MTLRQDRPLWLRWEHLCFLVLAFALCVLRWGSILAWISVSRVGERASDYWVVPMISAFLCFERRHAIFCITGFSRWGFLPLVVGLSLSSPVLAALAAGNAADAISMNSLGLVLALAGAFLAFYGEVSARRAAWPLALLLLAVPMPIEVWNRAVVVLQHGSAMVVGLLFHLVRVPFVREGLRFDLSRVSIIIDPQCSGIRSSYALLVLAAALCYLALRSPGRRLILLASVLPLALLKNGIRIVTLTLLAEYVNPSYLRGTLHHDGGFVFFGVALALEILLCWALGASERKTERALGLTGGNRNPDVGSPAVS
jgi:exosortase